MQVRLEANGIEAGKGVVSVVDRGDRIGDATAEQDDLVAFLPRADEVVDVARLVLEPAHIGRASMARHDAEARGAIAKEADALFSRGHRRHVPAEGQVHEDRVAHGDADVVRDVRVGKLDRLDLHGAPRARDAIAIVRTTKGIEGEEDQLAGARIDLGMRRHARQIGHARARGAERLERGNAERHRRAREPTRREQLLIPHDEIGVRRVLRAALTALDGRLVQAAPERPSGFALAQERWRVNPPISVRNAAILDMNGVHHPVAVEPMMPRRRRERRIARIAEKRPLEPLGKRAFDLQIEGLGLAADEAVLVAEVG